jgi:uncharacterized protein (TIGR03435 family)
MMSMRIRHRPWKIFLLVGTFIVLVGQAGFAQKDSGATKVLDVTGPAFEAATVRPTNRGDGRSWFGMRLTSSGRYQASAVSLSSLVWTAYLGSGASDKGNVTTDHSAPKWINSDEFDIQAKIDDQYLNGWDKLSNQQRMDVLRPMLRQLLAERFHLKLRTEIQKTPVYALVQAKGGAHVKEVPPPLPVEGDPMEAQTRWMTDNPGKIYPGSMMCTGDKCTAKTVKISDAIWQIEAWSQADRIVIDQTGLKGYYDFELATPDKDEAPMQQVEEDLGMKFEPRTVPIETYVIQSAEKPSLDGN